MKINNVKPFIGQHCETTSLGSLLNHIGIEFSEPMLFGLGEGFGYLIWKMKSVDFPFIGGRIKTDHLTANLCRNLNLKLEVKETSSLKKAWKNIEVPLSEGKMVGLKLDCYHLDYFTKKIHFAGHYAAMYGYDEKFAYLIDTKQQGCQVKTTLENLALARNEKGSMSSRNLSFTIEQKEELPELRQVIRKALLNNVKDYLNPPIKNFGYKGILKTSDEIKKWFNESKDIKNEFLTSAMLMEKAGTGGALFRNLYRDFLKEAAEVLKSEEVETCHQEFKSHAKKWTEISKLFIKISETKDVKYLNKASEIFRELSFEEKESLEKLHTYLTR